MKRWLKFLPITCFCFATVYCAIWTRTEPWLTPPTFVDDGKPYYEFTCTAYLRVDEVLLWARKVKSGRESRIKTSAGLNQIEKHYSGFVTTRLFWPIDQSENVVSIFCVKKSDIYLKKGKYQYNFTNSKDIPIAFQRNNLPLEGSKEPQVMPEAFMDDGKSYIEFICWAFLKEWQMLSWFQVKESNVIERLAVIQHDTFIEEYRKITLMKTLEASDKGSQIYCATETLLEGGTYKKGNESQRISLMFDRHVKLLKPPHVTVDPNTDTVLFEEHEVLEFVCSGSAPVDGRGYTWHLQGSTLHSFAPPGQKFDKFTNLNHLYLPMEAFYHGNQLYCAQDFALKVSPQYGELIARSYRELARSRMITLLHRKQQTPEGAKWSKSEPWVTPPTFVDDGRPFFEFTCHAYLGTEEYLGWFKGTDDDHLTYLKQFKFYNGYRKLNLLLPVDKTTDGAKIFCARKHSPVKNGKKTYKFDKSVEITINFQRDNVPSESVSDPQVTPEAFIDDGKPYIEFTCWAHMKQWEALTWFQIKDSNIEKLAMTQQEAEYGYIKSVLLRTLKPSDNRTEIYCAKEKVLHNGNYETQEESKRILITFDRHIEPLEPAHVTVEPGAEVVLFDDDEQLEFLCSGSVPVDGRALTWYSDGPFPRQVLPVVQRYNKLTNLNHLKLRMSGPHHGSWFYCAQDYTLKTSPVFGELITTSYGELARSRMIKVLHRNQDNPGESPIISPKKFVDASKPFIEFTCYAFLQKGHLLSWYQSKGSSLSKDSLLRTIQLQNPQYEGGQWTELTLNKTLEQSDKGCEIYCVKQRLLPDGSVSVGLESQRVPITNRKDISLLELPYVIIAPNTSIIYYNVNTTLRFTCSGSIPLDGRTYTWLRMDSGSAITVPEEQKYEASTNLNVLQLSVSETYHQSQLYCAQVFLVYMRHSDGSLRSKIYGELAKSDVITLILPEKAKPQVTPEKIDGKNKSFIQFTCRAFLQTGGLLSWFQLKGSPRSEKILLRMKQLVDPVLEHGQWVELTLKKSLEQSDKDSEIYCVKQRVLPDGSFSEGLGSQRVPLTFSRDFPPIEVPYVSIEPNTNVHYVVGTTLRLNCSGSYPVDDRTYTWFRIDSDSNLIVPEGQTYDASANVNVLELSLNESYNRSQLYCAQGFLSNIRHVNGSLRTKFYGELSKSDAITLILIVKSDKPEITPETFVDEGQPIIQFTCHAILETGQLLSWYQSKGSDRSKDTLLRTIQQEDTGTKNDQLVTLVLKKTLEQSDKDSEIYCSKQSVLPEGSSSEALESLRVPLIFKRDIPLLEPPVVITEPNTNKIYFDTNTTLRFTCSGSIPVDGRTYTWLRIALDSAELTIAEEQKYDAVTNLNVLNLSLIETYHQNKLYCAQGFISYIRQTNGSLRSKIYGELARSDLITLIQPEKAKPQVTPEHFEDKNKSFIQFTCRAFLQTGEILSWYQSKELPKPEKILLRMIQLQDPVLKHGQWVELTLKKTLKQSDKDSEIYCVKQRVLPDGSFSDGLGSHRVPLTFLRDFPHLELPFISIKPNTNVHYVVGTKLHFTCSGNQPVDDRIYTWFRIDSDSNLIVPEGQKYDASANVNVLELSLDESYNRSQLYCAQGFLSNIRHVNGSLRTKFYGELSKSEAITLILHVRGDKPEISPENFVDDGGSVIQFTCYAYLETGQLLSWYQTKGLDRSKNKLLKLIQLEDPGTSKGQLVTLLLKKTLEPSDKDSEIYCSKQSVLPDGRYSEALESLRVPLAFKRDIAPLELPFVITEPNANIVYFDINTTLRFTCSGSIPLDGRTYTWLRIDSESNLSVPGEQKYDSSRNLNVLNLSPSESYHQNELFCVQGFLSCIQQADGSLNHKIYGELAKSNVITLILPEKAKPEVTPEEFVDRNISTVQFTCRAFLQTGELLSWYQSKGSPRLKTVLLRMIQLKDPILEYGQWVELNLKKTLEQADKDSEIYCVKQRVLPDGSFSDGLGSHRVPLKYKRDIQPLEAPFVSTEPNSSLHYVVDTKVRFTCSGSRPVDERTYTWFIKDSDSNLIVPEGQKYDASANVNVLELSLDESYNRSQLYCAQGFLSNIRHADGSLRTKFYGELSKSDAITLILLVKSGHPQVYPEQFIDKLESSMQFKCYAFLRVGELLSWYQSKGKERSADQLLRMIQLQDHVSEDGRWMELTLNKTLEQSDSGSEVYCSKQSLRSDGSFSDGLESQRVPLMFHREIPASELPYVTVAPASSVHFHVNSTRPDLAAVLRFTCSGSYPVDGRTYTWFRIDSNSNITVPEDQKYDASTNLNVLYLSLKDTYHESRLYCAQGFLAHLRDARGALRSQPYGELARSGLVSLLMTEKVEQPEIASPVCPMTEEPWSPVLWVALPLALAALAAVLAALVVAPPPGLPATTAPPPRRVLAALEAAPPPLLPAAPAAPLAR